MQFAECVASGEALEATKCAGEGDVHWRAAAANITSLTLIEPVVEGEAEPETADERQHDEPVPRNRPDWPLRKIDRQHHQGQQRIENERQRQLVMQHRAESVEFRKSQ